MSKTIAASRHSAIAAAISKSLTASQIKTKGRSELKSSLGMPSGGKQKKGSVLGVGKSSSVTRSQN
jgi:hypothetical protein